MKFICTIVVVEDVFRARKLYEGILGQKVTGDFGEYNVAFEGGLAFYKKGLYESLIGGERGIASRGHNFELYFEHDRLDETADEIERCGFEFIHKIREEPWKQRSFRFYDADQNVVAVAETMEKVSHRLFKEGHSVEEISRMTGEPVSQVRQEIQAYEIPGGKFVQENQG